MCVSTTSFTSAASTADQGQRIDRIAHQPAAALAATLRREADIDHHARSAFFATHTK